MFGFRRIDVDAARHDHVGHAIGDEEIARIIDIAHFAQGEDAGRDMGGGGLFRVAAIDDAMAAGVAEIDLAHLVGAQHRAIIAIDDGFERGQGAADRSGTLQPFGRGDEGGGAGLGAAIGLHQHRAEPVDHRLLDGARAGRAGMGETLDAGDVIFRAHLFRQGEHALEMGGDHDRSGDPIFLDQRQRLFRVEMLDRDEAHAAEHVAGHAERAGMVERADGDAGRGRDACAHRFRQRLHRGDAREILRRGLGRLGPAGGAGGIMEMGQRRDAGVRLRG